MRTQAIVDTVLTACLVVTFAGLLSVGCVTNAEHKAFIEASRSFYGSVAPTFEKAVNEDDGLSDQSKKNRLGELSAYEKALEAAEARIR